MYSPPLSSAPDLRRYGPKRCVVMYIGSVLSAAAVRDAPALNCPGVASARVGVHKGMNSAR